MKYRLLLLLFVFSAGLQAQALIPKVKDMQLDPGQFTLDASCIIVDNPVVQEDTYLQAQLQSLHGLSLTVQKNAGTSRCIQFEILPIGTQSKPEWYQMGIDNQCITIRAYEAKGLFYGVQTLLQLIPNAATKAHQLNCCRITDEPKFSWRGMHLDVARHMYPVAFIKRYIDFLAMYKMNTFHWHLTDDQGWRIEIKRYPLLTQVGANRKRTMKGHYNDQQYDDVPYGGFYTQDEVKEVVAYAASRHITVVPEIEMPGHAMAALAAYPELACTAGPFEVAQKWGVFEDVFCPKEETFAFLEGVLTEVMELFPSPYIHIGGDECPKERWRSCAYCQALMQREGLKDEHELQSYFIRRIEKFVNSKKRKIIGWDEILEGGLAPNAAVMSWRGTEGGIAAAKSGHYAVMSPGSHCYFDHYQGNPSYEPLAIGGYTTLEKVYSYNPIPAELNATEANFILGAQANVWTEYIPDAAKVEYMAMPRMAALAEVVWGTAQPADYKGFLKRMFIHLGLLDKLGVNYSKSIFNVEILAQSSLGKGVNIVLKSPMEQGEIRYTTDGTEPSLSTNLYQKALPLKNSFTLKAAYFEQGQRKSKVIEQAFVLTKSTGKHITLVNPPSPSYSGSGPSTLNDGVLADPSKYGKDWLGFSGTDLEATIDLGKVTEYSSLKLRFLERPESWIYYPSTVEVLESKDGKNYNTLGLINYADVKQNAGQIQIVKFAKAERKTRYIKVVAKNYGNIPLGAAGEGHGAWLFVDEIMVD